MKSSIPSAPAALEAAGKDLWKEVHRALPDRWAFDERELTVLGLACRQADDLARLERAIKRDGTMTTGSTGQPVLHPALTEARQARSTIERLLRQLDLPSSVPAQRSEDKPARRVRAA